MKGSLLLGKISGIKIQVHWSFLLLIAWVVFVGISGGVSTSGLLWNILFVLVLFGCVVLHELGHALTAQRYKIQTKQITLLPIGGVANLEEMPEEPHKELFITLAGPAVNVFIALLLYLIVPFELYTELDPEEMEQLITEISARNFLFLLFYANVILAAFNFIPAFPMDGGRILRALLSMRMDRVQATQIAARLGQFVAFLFFLFGLVYNPVLVLIAVFVFFGAQFENVYVQQLSVLKGYQAKDALMTNITILNIEDTIEDVINVVLEGTERDFIVASNGDIAGVIYNADLIKAINQENDDIKVKDIMRSDFESIQADEDLTNVLMKFHSTKRSFFPVLQGQKIIGAIDLNNINEFMIFRASGRRLTF